MEKDGGRHELYLHQPKARNALYRTACLAPCLAAGGVGAVGDLSQYHPGQIPVYWRRRACKLHMRISGQGLHRVHSASRANHSKLPTGSCAGLSSRPLHGERRMDLSRLGGRGRHFVLVLRNRHQHRGPDPDGGEREARHGAASGVSAGLDASGISGV